MQVTSKHIATLEWQHELADKFERVNSACTGVSLKLVRSEVVDAGARQLIIDLVQICVNRDTRAVFLGKTRTLFDIADATAPPSTTFLTALIEEVSQDFEQIYHEEVAGTHLAKQQLPAFTIRDYRDDIQNCIDAWAVPNG